MEAAVILAKCTRRKLVYGMRTQKMDDGDWWRTWAFPLDEYNARNEGYDKTIVQGNMYYTKEYPGCPYCKTKNFVQCGKCKKLSCWNSETKLTCLWCGNNMDSIVTTEERFNLSGGDI